MSKFKIFKVLSICSMMYLTSINVSAMDLKSLAWDQVKSHTNYGGGGGIKKTDVNTKEQCDKHLNIGQPSVEGNSNIRICRDGYALMYNTQTKTPIWVVEKIQKENLFGKGERKVKFYADPVIKKSLQAEESDFSDPNIDQGHMAPAADFSNDQQLMDESFYFTNIVPQNAKNNRGIWSNLEKKVRTWVSYRDELYVITGPVFKNMQINKTIGKNNVAYPDYLFKIIYDAKTNGTISFLMPNEELDADSMMNYISTINEIEKATGLNFINAIPNNKEIKAKKSGMWTK